jgi:hypothetical protein
LLLFGLFNEAVSTSGYTASNNRMNNEERIVKDMEGSSPEIIKGTTLVVWSD